MLTFSCGSSRSLQSKGCSRTEQHLCCCQRFSHYVHGSRSFPSVALALILLGCSVHEMPFYGYFPPFSYFLPFHSYSHPLASIKSHHPGTEHCLPCALHLQEVSSGLPSSSAHQTPLRLLMNLSSSVTHSKSARGRQGQLSVKAQ